MKRFKRVLGAVLAGVSVSALLRAETPVVSDRHVVHKIHSDIVADESLPYCAHIVKVQAKQGTVILDGRVETEQQKRQIENKAAKVAGVEDVVNNIVVKD